ncbi:Disease resistance protein RGA2 [Rhynchospora pubera]|uniref:Disease resistance protein RGA2 n=1 Tax=Rhynchospora pubera TaxID=906938 RepID=A0AAV8BYQ5_9POAL|nr:Disease resistance protein RGA2 [Rhynchospora pubera]
MKEQKYFDILLWVHCSRRFSASDVVMHAQQNKQARDGVAHVGNYNRFISLEALTGQMNAMLGSKKFLLILDDFWCDADDFIDQWEKFVTCLKGGLPGSKILLTTQSNRTVEKTSIPGVTEVKHYPLLELENGHFFKLFMHHSWPSNCSLEKEKFECIGHNIAAKLKGDPGTAKIVGRQLRENIDIRYWEDAAKKDWLGDNMKARIWSYQQLPVHLQQCFAICCIFKKGYILRAERLIQLWMAEGLIKTINKEERMEDIGQSYLNELVSRFFLERHEHDKYGTYYQLHDLLHDLAECVQGDGFIGIEYTNSKNIPEHISRKLSRCENIRHISLPVDMVIELKDKICLMKNLCTLLCDRGNGIIPRKVLREILKNTKKLRVLAFPLSGQDLPDCIGNLKHLRFLFVHGSKPFKKLPDSICKLYLLQSLHLPSCDTLPKKFSELICLRFIDIKGETMSHISDLGRMTSLQVLRKFAVRKERKHELHQLENLNQLRGRLCITGLENVRCKEDAIRANLQRKSHIEELEVQWNSGERATDDFQVLDALQPHHNIRDLKIERFRGKRFPNWLLNNESFECLTKLQLIDCTSIKELPLILRTLQVYH